MSVWLLTLGSVVMVSLVSFVGLIFLSRGRSRLDALLMYLVSLAAGVLLGTAFFHLIPEAFEILGGSVRLPVYVLAGFLGFFFLERFLWAHHHGHGEEPVTGRDCHENAVEGPVVPGLPPPPHDPDREPPRRARPVVVMSLVGDGLHNFIDGMLIAAAYGVSPGLGFVTTGAVLLHEVPQEAGEFGVLVRGGLSVEKALWLNFLSASMAIVGALVALVAGAGSSGFTVALVPVTAGTFIYIAAADLIPELHHKHERRESVGHAALLVAGVALTLALRVFAGHG
jgi:zinc and cadmium transporter